jgi:PAS domain S-box-containing protein
MATMQTPPNASARTPLEELRAAVAAAGMETFVWDVASGDLQWSSGIAALFGLERAEFDGRFETFLSLLPEEDRSLVTTAIDRALRGETPEYDVEHRVRSRSGAVTWVACHGIIFRDREGKPTRMVGLVSNVAERKETEARLAQLHRLGSVVRAINKQILHVETERELFDSACRIAVELGKFRFAWVGLVSKDGTRVEPDARAGYEDGYLDSVHIEVGDTPYGRGPVGTSVREGRYCVVNDTANDPRFLPWRDGALKRGYLSCTSFPLRRGGRVIGALCVYAPLPHLFDDEQLALFHGLADDMSYALDLIGVEERKRAAEVAMRASEERYRTLFEQAVEGIVLVGAGAEYRMLDVNESACRMFGYPREELIGSSVAMVVDRADLAAAPLRFPTIPRGGMILSDRHFARKDGKRFAGEVSTKALADGTFQCVVRDVTERKNVQAQLLLADRMTSLGRLASGVAHEVNNPLAYVMLNLELVAKRLSELTASAPQETAELLARAVADARDGADRVRRIVRMLSTFGRGDEELVGPVDVSSVLDSAADIAAMQLRHRARVIKRYDASHPARANAFRLGQVFVNLLVNAADALKEDAPENEISLHTYNDEAGAVVVTVRDNGVGMAREVQARIFDPFFTTKPIGQGTGLGLSVCHAIVTSFGGTIACDSAPGAGTTFTVTLPPARVDATAEPHSAPLRAPNVRGRVLVVDDDPRVATAVAGALGDHDVVVASSGREALQRCRSERFDCVVCDLMMPEVTGMDVYESLRADARGMEARIVFMTGGAVTEHAQELLANVPNRVLEKPIDADVLKRVVAKAIEAARGG